MRSVVDVAFRDGVKFPTGKNGQGRNKERQHCDHPENPDLEYALTYDDETELLTVVHSKTGNQCVVPRENIAWMRFGKKP